MTLGKKIRACRQEAGMSQEKVAELVGVSRQAVTKWEADQSVPHTEHLFRLSEIFGTTVDLLLPCREAGGARAEQLRRLTSEAEKRAGEKKRRQKRNILTAQWVAAGYMFLYFIGRAIWCDLSQCSLTGWLFTAAPSGRYSYLYGWLLSSGLFWCATAVSVVPALFGKRRFSCATLAAFVLGLLSGMALGPQPEGAAWGQGHYGWAIWGAVFLLSIPAGILLERWAKRSPCGPAA